MSEPGVERNKLGPIGFYDRDTFVAKSGYDSLKEWEKTANVRCRFVVTVGNHIPTAKFIAYARYRGGKWVFSVPSPSATDSFVTLLKQLNLPDKIVATQVVPPLDSPLPIVADARKALGARLTAVSLEGFLVGKMALAILRSIDGPLSQENFLKAARKQIYNLGGFAVDFTNDTQGSDFVLLTYVNGAERETEPFVTTLKTLMSTSQ